MNSEQNQSREPKEIIKLNKDDARSDFMGGRVSLGYHLTSYPLLAFAAVSFCRCASISWMPLRIISTAGSGSVLAEETTACTDTHCPLALC